MITAGKLNRRIVIQSPVNSVDEYGQKTQGWEQVAEVFAEIRPIGAKEKLRAMEYDAILTHQVTVRYQPHLLPTVGADAWRILYGNRTFIVNSAQEWMDARQWIIFEAREIGN